MEPWGVWNLPLQDLYRFLYIDVCNLGGLGSSIYRGLFFQAIYGSLKWGFAHKLRDRILHDMWAYQSDKTVTLAQVIYNTYVQTIFMRSIQWRLTAMHPGI